MQGLSHQSEEVTITHLMASTYQKAAGVVAAVFTAVVILCTPISAFAAGWSYYERRGDERMATKRWSQAKEYYMKAITAAGDSAPRPLWEKYNSAFQNAWREEQVIRMKIKRKERAARLKEEKEAAALKKAQEKFDGGKIPVEDESTENTAITTIPEAAEGGDPKKEGYVEILPDGTVKMSIEDYLKGGRVTRLGNVPGGSPRVDPNKREKEREKPQGPQPTSFWREPLADRSGGRSQFSPDEKVGLSTVRTAAGGVNADKAESSTITTPEYEVSNIRVRFIGSSKLLITGSVKNKTRFPFHNARVYVRLYNETGVFRGRNWGYLKRGRQTLNPGRSKDFEVKFFGYTGTVGSYKIEVVANFKR